MSDIAKLLASDPQRLLDRLVDGELLDEEQRQLLAALDEEPGGWRRCALAFVEAGAWRAALGELAGPNAAMSLPIAVQRPSPVHRSSPAGWTYLAALAASVLVAFACGRYWAPAAAGPVAMAQSAPATQIVAAPAEPAPPAPAEAAAAPAYSDADWETVQLNIEDAAAGEPDTVEVPCLDVSRLGAAAWRAAGLEADWLADQASALPAAWLQTLRETGYTVETQRELRALDMSDGRRVVVPVEEVELRYAGGDL